MQNKHNKVTNCELLARNTRNLLYDTENNETLKT